MSIDWDKNVLAPLHKVFGETVNYRPAIGSAYDIDEAVFDNPNRTLVLIDDTSKFNTACPTLGVRRALLQADAQQGDKVYIPSVDQVYMVTDANPDSHGEVRLQLQKAAS